MTIVDEDKRRENLRSFLFSLAKSQDYLQDESNRYATYARLEEIYHTDSGTDFRHFYSDIFSVLTIIKNDNSRGDINILGQNMSIIRSEYQPKNEDINGNLIDISDSIRKLYDHVSLDVARITYSENQNRIDLGQDRLDNIEAQSKGLEKSFSDIQKEITEEVGEVKKELKESQKEHISILGIFSAVVLAFTANIAFSTSVLENFHKASIYRTSFICLLIAFATINILYLLFAFINKIVHGTEEKKQCLLKKHFPIVIADIMIGVAMLVVVICWARGVVEKRDKCINEQNIIQSEAEDTSEINNNNIVPNQIQPKSEEITNSDATTDNETPIQFEAKGIETGDTNVENTNPVSSNQKEKSGIDDLGTKKAEQ